MNMIRDILITGVSSALGGVLAEELSRIEGARIIGSMRRGRGSKDRFASNVELVDHCDLTDPKECNRLAGLVSERFKGPIGFIHSVGGFTEHASFLDFAAGDAASMVAEHLNSLQNMLYSLLPIMIERGGGSCIAFSCGSVRHGYPWMASYTASKSAIESLVFSLANEFGGQGIRLNALALSTLKTDKERMAKPHGDFEHFTPPNDIAPIVRFLLSHDSYLINGNSLRVYQYSNQFFSSGYFQRITK
jgi:NAD(P)-dependent dehydrogenase (short-subunit alcohol dehydrogenase family)